MRPLSSRDEAPDRGKAVAEQRREDHVVGQLAIRSRDAQHRNPGRVDDQCHSRDPARRRRRLVRVAREREDMQVRHVGRAVRQANGPRPREQCARQVALWLRHLRSGERHVVPRMAREGRPHHRTGDEHRCVGEREGTNEVGTAAVVRGGHVMRGGGAGGNAATGACNAAPSGRPKAGQLMVEKRARPERGRPPVGASAALRPSPPPYPARGVRRPAWRDGTGSRRASRGSACCSRRPWTG